MNFTKINLWFALIVMVSFFTACKKESEREVNPRGEYAPSIQSVATCTYTIPLNQSVVDAKSLNIGPGSVVCLEAGTRGALWLKNFVGSATNPIIFVNKGGKVIFKTTGSYGLKVQNSKYLKFTGTGSTSDKYGIEVDGPHIGMSFESLTTNVELEYTEIHNIGFAGVMCKTDPSCDPATWRDNFVMRDIVMHHNYVYKTGGEGFYIGNSFYAKGRSESCGTVYPHSIENLSLHDNIVKYTDAEGIQVGCVLKGSKIYNNSIEYYGQDPFANYQNNGMQIGEGTGGLCYNNTIKNGAGNGMIVLGLGDNIIFNNVISNAGSNGIFIDERYTPGPSFSFYNNTIVNPKGDGMKFYSELIPMNNVINNIIINPGSGKYITTNSGVKLTQSNNYTSTDIASVKFVNASGGDYKLQSGSPAVDAGANLATKGVTFDFTGAARPSGSGFDIGAYEYGATGGTDGGSGGTDGGTGGTDGGSGGTDGGSGGDGSTGGTTDIKVVSLTLINAETSQDIMTMTPGMVIDFAKIGTSKINIRANTSPSKVGSIVFGLDGNNSFRTETYAPYALQGDGGGKYNAWTPSTGSHSVTATPYTLASGAGTKGTPLVINFTVGTSTTDGGTGGTGDGGTGGGGSTSPLVIKTNSDAYLQSGTRYNNSILRVQSGTRVAYMKFTVSGAVNSAKLRFKVDSDGGYGNLKVGKGSHSNWTETTLTSTTAPSASWFTSSNQTWTVGKIYEVDVTNAISGPGTYTIMFTMDSGNDFSFSSKEGSYAPQLIIQ